MTQTWRLYVDDNFQVNESVEVLVENINDNPPNFAQNHFVLEVNEVSSCIPENVIYRRNVM